MGVVVQKYGGKLVENKEKMEKVANSIISSYKKGNKVVAVISAIGNTTDELNDKINEITNLPNLREMDVVLSSGEQISIGLLAIILNNMGYKVISLTGWQAGIVTDSNFTNANIKSVNTELINNYLNEGFIVLIAGFQGIDINNNITTLGRGGSDTTATELAVFLNADCCEIYKDTKSIYTADPKIIPTAKKISLINYNEMLQLAKMGAKILSAKSIEFAKKNNLTLVIKSVEENIIGSIINGEKTGSNFQIISCTKKRINEKFDILTFILNENANKNRVAEIMENIIKSNHIYKYIIEKCNERTISIIIDKDLSKTILKQIHDKFIL